MFEVLMFLFENYMDSSILLTSDNLTIASELEKAGFNRIEIDSALDWLQGLTHFQDSSDLSPLKTSLAIRHYLPEERDLLGKDSIGFLHFLEQLGILDPVSREIVIDRLMALDPTDLDLGRIKWVVLMVLFSQPEKKSALSLLQDMILTDVLDVIH